VQSSQIWTAALFYGTAQGLLLLFAMLIGHRGRRLSNTLLAAMLFWSVIHVANSLLVSVGLNVKVPWLLYVTVVVSPAVGPLYYFYTRSLLAPEYRPNVYIAAVVLILPGLLWLTRMIWEPFNLDAQAAWFLKMRDGTPVPLRIHDLAFPAAAMGYLLIFLVLTWRYVHRARLEIRKYFAKQAGGYVVWLGLLGGGLLVYVVVALASLLYMATIRQYSITEYRSQVRQPG
jgi:hypothetical protein